MRLWAYVIAICAVFSSGWMGHSAYYSKEQLNETQKAERKYNALRESQAQDRAELEKQHAKDNQTAAKRLQQALGENAKLRAEADARVDISFLIYSKLCESPDDCALFYRRIEADGTTQALSPPTALDLYAVLRDVTDAIQEHNLQIEQINRQIKECKKVP